MSYSVSIFSSVKNNEPNSIEHLNSFNDFSKWLLNNTKDCSEKEDSNLYSTWVYPNPKIRKDAVSTNILVMDTDKPISNDQLKSLISTITDMSKSAIIHDTYSSRNNSRKLRIIFPLDNQYSPKDIKTMINGFVDIFSIDISSDSKQTGRIYYFPFCPIEQDGHEWRCFEELEILDVIPWSLADLKPISTKSSSNKSSSKVSLNELAKMLSDKFIEDLSISREAILYHEGSKLFYIPENNAYLSCSSSHLIKKLALKYEQDYYTDAVKKCVDNLEVYCLRDHLPKPSRKGLYQCDDYILDTVSGSIQENDYSLNVFTRLPIALTSDFPNLKPSKWLSFLDETFHGADDKEDRILLLQQFFGYILTSDLKSQTMLWMLGEGSNGKSVIMNLMGRLLGNHNTSCISLNDLGKRFTLGRLEGKLLNISDEVSSDRPLHIATLKELVSSMTIAVENKGVDIRNGRHHTKIIAAMNKLPEGLSDNSYGFSRRVRILHFENIVTKPNPNLLDELIQEGAAIIAWAIDGLRSLESFDYKMVTPISSDRLILSLLSTKNSFSDFVEDVKLLPSINNKVKKSSLYEYYVSWCEVNGYIGNSVLSNVVFGKSLKKLMITESKSGNERYYNVVYDNSTLESTGSAMSCTVDELSEEFV